MLVGLILLFVLVPLAEIYVIIEVGRAIGPWWTILLLVVASIAGAQLVRRQGRVVWRRFQEALAANRMPHREVLDGVLVIVSGALLVTPGFITDVFALLGLLPPVRAIVRRAVLRAFTPASMARTVFVRVGPSLRHPAPGSTQQAPRRFDQEPPPGLPRE